MENTWITDKNGNRASVEYFGSEEKAQATLDSLKNCKDCTNCSDCSGCSGCSYCSDCSGCSGCSGCSYCSYCSYCSDCSYCSCCSGCSGCSGCSDCSGCSGCSDCSGCSGCSYCSDCSGCSDCSDKKGDKGKAPISVPVIPEIHKAVYAAASAPQALDMGTWHTCETTHCRAGWVVKLAGPDGKALENRFNNELAAMMIYSASDPEYKINPCRFYDTNEAALEDMRKLAEKV